MQENLPTKRRDAIALGLTRYSTGKPCKRGHLCEYTVYGGCIECCRERDKLYEKTPEGKERRKAIQKRYRQSPSGREAMRRREARRKNTEVGRAYILRRTRRTNRKRYALGKDRKSTWYQRTPKWADTKAITEFMLDKPPGYHLDHIIPIRGENVCGLHVLENLQYLSAEQNVRKSNSVIPITLEAAVCPLDITLDGNPAHVQISGVSGHPIKPE